jgi:hypothetical protein
MAATTDTLRGRLTEAMRVCGGWSTVHIDLSNDRETEEGIAETRRRSVRDRLNRAGAEDATAEAVDEALSSPSRLPSPFHRFLLARDGRVVVDESIPGTAPGETLEVGPLPCIAPLIATGVDEFAYLVVRTSRDGGDIAVHRTGAFFPEARESVEGRTDTLHKVKGGGWAHLNQQEHVEELWKQTQHELSAEVDRLVREVRPRLLVVAGDITASRLLLDALAPSSRALAVELPANVRSGGTDDGVLETFVAQQLAALERREREEAVDLLRTREGQDRPAADVGVRAVAEALRQAQVDTLFVDVAALEGETLLALDEVPWVAWNADDAGPAGVVGEVPAVEALLRAALLTDARILTASQAAIGAGAAALLRWPVDVPARA